MRNEVLLLGLVASVLSDSLPALPRDVASSGGGTPPLDFSDAAPLQPRIWNGKKYGCKCYLGDKCWPSSKDWHKLNTTVGGNLLVGIPPGAPCHDSFQGPLGTLSTYNAAECANVQANFANETWTVDQPAAELWTYWTNETCRPTANPPAPCTLGNYPIYVIMANTKEHIKAGIDFARQKGVRVIIRNTGHDFIGRSTGWGSLVINTHSFQDVTWIKKYSGPGAYTGSAVKIGAGVQGRSILTQGHAQKPPVVVVTGECPTVGIAGGFIQGGGHGPWTTLKGFSADNVLSFDVITSSGQFITANEAHNPDLFWALKGGGPASYAVILSVTMKTFLDVKSSGAIIYINSTLTNDTDVWWSGMTSFHKYSNHFVDNGLYAYFEVMPQSLRVRPWVAIGKTSSQLKTILQPFLSELDENKVPYDFAIKDFSTFYDLYIDMFEDEFAGGSALTGGWMLNHDDVANRNDQIIEAMKTVLSPAPDVFSFMIGHLFNPGFNVPVPNSATNPGWRNATDFVITSILVEDGASLARKAYYQNILTHTIDDALRKASRSGTTYVNEADPFQPNWQTHFWGTQYSTLKETRNKWDPLGIFYAISTPGTENWAQIQDETRLCKAL